MFKRNLPVFVIFSQILMKKNYARIVAGNLSTAIFLSIDRTNTQRQESFSPCMLVVFQVGIFCLNSKSDSPSSLPPLVIQRKKIFPSLLLFRRSCH